MGGKLAVVRHRQSDVGITDIWELVVAGELIELAWTERERLELEMQAYRINAAVDAEVERRLDEITRKAVG